MVARPQGLTDRLHGMTHRAARFAERARDFYEEQERRGLERLLVTKKTLRNIAREAAYGLEQAPYILDGFMRQNLRSRSGEYQDIGETIDRLVDGSPDGRIIIVGYSLGGVHARAYAQLHPERVALCFMVCTPQQGTPLAVAGKALCLVRAYGPSVEQMVPENGWLRALNADYQESREAIRQAGARLVNFRAEHDELVPLPYSRLDDADAEFRFGGLGHMSAVHSSRLYYHLVHEMKQASGEARPILLLHGYAVDQHMFIRLRRQLEERHHDLTGRLHAISYDYTRPVIFSRHDRLMDDAHRARRRPHREP